MAELLATLQAQTYKHFEVLIIEDGSQVSAAAEVAPFQAVLDLHYLTKPNSGQGFSRNFGLEHARGDFFILLDSDVLVPPNYLELVNFAIQTDRLDAFGGPDAAHPDFSPVQQAISYAMTSFFTTGGIRGRSQNLGGKFHPRSFNMGFSRQVWERIGGFIITRLGEDIEFSIRMQRAGFRFRLIPGAYVYHKRRTSLSAFYRQIHFFGRARINIYIFHPAELKLVHFFPALFTTFIVFVVVAFGLHWYQVFIASAWLLIFYAAAIFVDAIFVTKNLYVAFLSLCASFIQLFGYGVGFTTDFLKRLVFKHK